MLAQKAFDSFRASQEARYTMAEGHVEELQARFRQAITSMDHRTRLIIETGFNGGHSAAAFLTASPDVRVVFFDIERWDYVRDAKALIDDLYPGRHTLIRGDSRQTLPQYSRANPDTSADIAFIDGGHFGDVPWSDATNALKLLRHGGLLVMDDVYYPDVKQAWRRLHAERLVQDLGCPETDGLLWAVARKPI
jgi:predicted O-methyltransferase YrrM